MNAEGKEVLNKRKGKANGVIERKEEKSEGKEDEESAKKARRSEKIKTIKRWGKRRFWQGRECAGADMGAYIAGTKRLMLLSLVHTSPPFLRWPRKKAKGAWSRKKRKN